MFYNAIEYHEPLFRPPSEAYSFILQATFGCSWNECAFCEMYTSKKFKVKPFDEVKNDIEVAGNLNPGIKKVFLADGNVMVLSTKKLAVILQELNFRFPSLARISAYARPHDLENKTEEELKSLVRMGLKLIYVGIETGDDELLLRINKGDTYDSTKRNLLKARRAGLKISAMILTGLGGFNYSTQHALNSAKIVNEIQPEFLSTLVLSFPFGIDHYKSRFDGEFIPLDLQGLLKEQHRFISSTKLEKVVFRSDHASNYLVLKGILNRDKKVMLKKLEEAINMPSAAGLRQEWQRGL